jgi:hypothetical protein
LPVNDKGKQSKDLFLADSSGRFIRWQATQITQLGFILNLVLGFAVAGLGLWVTLLRDASFQPHHWAKRLFLLSGISLVVSIAVGLWCSLNRLWDFRITAGMARGEWSKEELAANQIKSDLLGSRTWRLLYGEISAFILGTLFLVATLALVYCSKLVATLPPNSEALVWQPKWETVPEKNKQPKPQLSPTLTFTDDWLGAVPVLDTDDQKRLHDEELHQNELFLDAFRTLPVCKGVTFMRSNPKSADFDVQIFQGLDGRAGKWQWVLYRTDITERLGYGEEQDVTSAARNICLSLLANVSPQGGRVE